MYQDFFELRELPFNITPDPKFLYFSEQHRRALDHLTFGILHRRGFIELIGEVGCGKTTLCRALLGRLPPTVKTALILNPAMTANQLLRAILTDLGQNPVGRDRLTLVNQLNAFLLEQTSAGMNVVVIIDESQNLLPEVMEQIRLLSNLETDQYKLLQIIIAGQPELKRRLAAPELRQLRQRIQVRCELLPMARTDTESYIRHRLEVAGAAADVVFEPDAIGAVQDYSRGIPRMVNGVSDRSMLAAYVARRRRIIVEDVNRAAEDLGEWTI